MMLKLMEQYKQWGLEINVEKTKYNTYVDWKRGKSFGNRS